MSIRFIESDDSYVFEASVVHEDYRGSCLLELIRVYDWYDTRLMINMNCNIVNGILHVDLDNKLEKGLYLLCSISINDTTVILGKREKEGFSVITSFYTGRDFRVSQQVLHDSYFKVIEHREEVFIENKGDLENGNTLFDCYAFVKNMKTDSIIQYGDIEVIPFDEYKALSESQMMDSFFTRRGIPFDYSSEIKCGFGSVIYMRNVLSDDKGDYAKKLIHKKAGIITNLFSLSNHDNCQIISTVIHNLSTGIYYINIDDPHYQGNLLRLCNQGFAIREEYRYLLENETNLNVFVKLFNEAEVEKDVQATYFRFWTLLEVMAEAHDIKDEDMTRWDGTVVISKNGHNKRIETSLDAVFELVRINYSEKNTKDFIKMASITDVREFLSVCYQRRCCYAHRGSCSSGNENMCDSNIREMSRCKASLAEKKGRINDPVLTRLEQLVRELIYKEIDQHIDIKRKDTEYLEGLLEQGYLAT